MLKRYFVLLFLVIIAVSPMLSFSNVLDPYGYPVLILTTAINTNGHIDFENFALGDHWRGHAQNMLGDIRPLTSILIAMLNQVTLIDPAVIANVPLFAILVPLIAFLFMRKFLTGSTTSTVGFVLLLFFITAISLLQPGELNYLSYGFFLMFLLFYLGIRWLTYGSSIDSILVILVFIAASRTYYTAYLSSALFLFGMLLYVILFLREKRRYWSFTLISVVFLFIVLWFDNIVQATTSTLSLENINQAINSILMFKPEPVLFNPYLEITSNPYLIVFHSIIRVTIGLLGVTALIACIKNSSIRKYLPIITGLFFMALFETVSYVFVGGVFLVRLMFAICLPFVIVLWIQNFGSNINYKKIGTFLLVVLCIVSMLIVFKNYEDTVERKAIITNAQLINSVTYDPTSFLKSNASYYLVAGSTESALLSYKTFKPNTTVLAGFGPLLYVADGNFDGFVSETKNLPQNEKLVFIPSVYSQMEVYAWGDIYSIRSKFYQELENSFNIIYDGPFLVYETT